MEEREVDASHGDANKAIYRCDGSTALTYLLYNTPKKIINGFVASVVRATKGQLLLL